MTPSQERAVARIRKEAENEFDFAEIKEFRINETEHFVYLFISIGMKGEENAMARLYCRDTIHVFIGKRGGITYPTENKKGKWCTKKYISFLRTKLDQPLYNQ